MKPRLERGLQESLRRPRLTRQLNSGKWGGVGGITRFVGPGPYFHPPRARWNYPSQQHPPPTTNMFVGLGSLSRGRSLLVISLIGYQGEVLRLLQPQLPFMYNSCISLGHPWSLASPLISSPVLLYLSFFARPVMLSGHVLKLVHAGADVDVKDLRRSS